MSLALVDEHTEAMPMSAAALQVMMEQNHEQAEDGHHRLRADYRELERRVETVERMLHTHALQLAKPQDVTQLHFPARIVLALCIISIGLGAGQYVLNARLESNVMAAIETNTKLWDERFATMQKSIDGTRNRLELLQIEFNTYQKEAAQERRRR